MSSADYFLCEYVFIFCLYKEYWNFKADKFMKAADKFNRNGLLSRAEIQSFAVGNTSGDDDDDRWSVGIRIL